MEFTYTHNKSKPRRRNRMGAWIGPIALASALAVMPGYCTSSEKRVHRQGRSFTSGGVHGSHFGGVKASLDERAVTLVEVADSPVGLKGRRFDPARGWHSEELSPAQLVGAEWLDELCTDAGDCAMRRFRVTAAARDESRNSMPAHASNRDVWLYNVHHVPAAGSADVRWQSLCQNDEPGMFVTGHWAPDGRYLAEGYTFSCVSGAIAKCARSFGYKPGKHVRAPSGVSVELRPLHLACVRAARADYCGDGQSHTRDGTPVVMTDEYHLNLPSNDSSFIREARFDRDGARDIARLRWPDDEGTPSCTPKPRRNDGQQPVIVVWSQRQEPE